MSSWLEVLNKFLDRSPLFPAGALSALTIGFLHSADIINDLKNEISWLWMFGVFCAWVTVCTWLDTRWKSSRRSVSEKFERWRNKGTQIKKLEILTDEQKFYLEFLKLKNMQHFQAWDGDAEITALERMDLIISHETTKAHYSRYEVPKHIWNKIEAANPANVRRRLGQHSNPWEANLHRRF